MAAVLVIALSGGAYMYMNKGPAPVAAADTSVAPNAAQLSQPIANTAGAVTMAQVKSLAGSLGTDTAKARTILHQFEQMRPVATDSTLDRLDIGIVQAKYVLNDTDGACELALRVTTRPLSEANAERLDFWLNQQLGGCK